MKKLLRNLVVFGLFATGVMFAAEFPYKVVFELETMHPVRVVDPGDNGYLSAFFYIPEMKAPTAVKAVVSIRDRQGKLVFPVETRDFTIWFNWHKKTYSYLLPCPKKYGVYDVTVELSLAANPEAKTVLRRPFAVAKLTGQGVPYERGQFQFGAQCHLRSEQPDDWKLDVESLRQIGVRFTRSDCNLEGILESKGKIDTGYMDSRLKYIRAVGMYPQVILSGCDAQWIHIDKDDPKLPNKWAKMVKPEVWEEYCNLFFAHYKDVVFAAEVWNEPDLPWFALYSPEEYQILAKIARKSRDKYAPNMPLMSAGFCSFDGEKGPFQENSMRLCAGVFDVHCFHGHGDFGSYRLTIKNKLFPMRKRLNLTIPWYPHETALSSTGTTEQHQAEALWKKIIFSWSEKAIGYTWYDHRNDGFDPKNPEHNYGLITRDFYPKAAYIAYNALIGLFNGNTTFVKTFEDDAFIYEFKRGKDILVCGWVHDTGTPGVRSYTTDAKAAEIIDIYGNITPAELKDGRVSLDVKMQPTVLRLKNATKCEKAMTMIEADTSKLFFKGESIPVTLTVKNPYSTAKRVRLEVSCPSGVSASEKSMSLDLKPRETVKKQIVLQGDTSRMASGSVWVVKASCQGGEDDYLRLPISYAVMVASTFSKLPTFVLDQRSQMVELFDANPGEVHRLRKDNQDLSALVWVAADGTSLRLRGVVTDDIHSQKNEAAKMWRGDSVQVFVQLPKQTNTWQMGCALGEDGKVQKAVWDATALATRRVLDAMECNVTREGTKTTYDLVIPWSALGTTEAEVKKSGFALNVMFNESDSDVRESWIMAAPGVGEGVNVTRFPSFLMK